MHRKIKKEPIEVRLPASIADTDLDDLVRCALTKFVPPKGALVWNKGHLYCLVYRLTEHPEPRIYIIEACRASMPEFKSSVEIRVPTLMTAPVVKAKGLDLEIIKALG